MANLPQYLVKGHVVHKEGDKNAFERITDLVTEWERASYPNMIDRKMHKNANVRAGRMKLLCHLNVSNVVEPDRVCAFKLIASSEDDMETATIAKNVCLKHTCQDPDFKNRKGGPTGKITSAKVYKATLASKNSSSVEGESAYMARKRRKLEQKIENNKEAWRLVNNEKMFIDKESFREKVRYFDQCGIYDMRDLQDFGPQHIEHLTPLLKDVPGKRWASIMNGTV